MKNSFFKNIAIITITSLILRVLGMVFRIWLSREIGSEGMGLLQLVLSFYVLICTFGTTGICTATSRLVAENEGNGKVVSKVMKRSMQIILIISAVTIILVYNFSSFIAKNIICDARAEEGLKMLLIGLPFLALSSGIRGYFLGKRKASIPSIAQIIEQIIRIAATFFLIDKALPFGLSATCSAIILGGALGEFAEFIFCFICLIINKEKPIGQSKAITKELLRISIPIMSGRYIHTALRTLENMLVPITISIFTKDKSLALSQFGNIKGMAIPLLFFPASFLAAFSTMMIPEISSYKSRGYDLRVKTATEKSIGITIIVSVLIGGIFFTLGKDISVLLYGSGDTGVLLVSLAPLVPLMYLESVCDGILKGLDQQKHSFIYGIIDSVTRLLLIYLLCPKYGIKGFLLIMIYSNMLTSLLNLRRLLKVAKINIKIKSWILKPLFSIIISAFIGVAVARNIGVLPIKILVCVSIISAVYIIILAFLGETKIAAGILRKSQA